MMASRPSSTTRSWIRTRFGWRTATSALRSWMKRATISGSSVSSSLSTFTATSTLVSVLVARHTVPIAPRPRRSLSR